MLGERSQCEQATYWMTPMGNHSGKWKTIEIAKRSVVAMGEGERDDWVEHRIILGQWNYSDDTVMVDTWHYAFIKAQRTVQQKEWNYGLYLIIVY